MELPGSENYPKVENTVTLLRPKEWGPENAWRAFERAFRREFSMSWEVRQTRVWLRPRLHGEAIAYRCTWSPPGRLSITLDSTGGRKLSSAGAQAPLRWWWTRMIRPKRRPATWMFDCRAARCDGSIEIVVPPSAWPATPTTTVRSWVKRGVSAGWEFDRRWGEWRWMPWTTLTGEAEENPRATCILSAHGDNWCDTFFLLTFLPMWMNTSSPEFADQERI